MTPGRASPLHPALAGLTKLGRQHQRGSYRLSGAGTVWASVGRVQLQRRLRPVHRRRDGIHRHV